MNVKLRHYYNKLSYVFVELLYIPFLEMWFEPRVISANIKMLLSTSEQTVTEGV